MMDSAILIAEVNLGALIGAGAAGLAIGAGALFLYFKAATGATRAEVEKIREQAVKDVDAAQREIDVERKEARVKAREELDASAQKQREEIRNLEKRLDQRETKLDRRIEQFEKKEDSLDRAEHRAQQRQNEAEKKVREAEELVGQHRGALERVSSMSAEQARQELLKRVEEECDREMAEVIERQIARAKENAEESARKIILQNIQRYAAVVTAENTTTVVDLPSDDLKGRIIGREGRNIRAFEAATGVDVIVDDTPGVVIVSAFDGVRRETARLAMEKLVADGRIHPARIEEVVAKTRKEMERIIAENGRKACQDIGIKTHKSLVNMMGRLKYRTSYGQNILDHSVEVAHLCGLIAADLGLDIKLAKRCGFLHDVGKAIDQEQEGTHPKIGAEAALRAGEDEIVVNAIASHHDDVAKTSLFAVLVQCGDAISAARPGARRESMERHIKRMEQLEEIATQYPAIEKAYAIQAGREVRVIAKADMAGEAECARICQQIAKQVEEEITYPGEIRVTLIRESRFIEYAR